MPRDLASLLFGPARQARALAALRGKPGAPVAKTFLTEMEALIQRRGRMSPVLVSLLDEAVKTLLAAQRLEEAVARAGLCAINESGELTLSRDAVAAFEAAGKIRDRHRKVLKEIEDRLAKEDLRPQGIAGLMAPYAQEGEADEADWDEDPLDELLDQDLSKVPGGPLNGLQAPIPYFSRRRRPKPEQSASDAPPEVTHSAGTAAPAERSQPGRSGLNEAPADTPAPSAETRAVPAKPPVSFRPGQFGSDASHALATHPPRDAPAYIRVPIGLFTSPVRYAHPFLDPWP